MSVASPGAVHLAGVRHRIAVLGGHAPPRVLLPPGERGLAGEDLAAAFARLRGRLIAEAQIEGALAMERAG